jgi:hypothetical protein
MTMADRVDKSWQDKGLAAYPVEALVGTLTHYGVAVDEASFKALAKENFPLAIAAQWSEAWKGTGKFKDFPFPAADELWRRWLKETLAPNELALGVLELLRALGRLEGAGPAKTPDAAFDAVEAMVSRGPPAGDARERFMAEVVQAMGQLMRAFDTAAEALAKKGEAQAATRFVALEEQLFPVRAGVSRLLVDAVLGKEPDTATRLEALAVDPARDAFARVAAVDALLHLAEGPRAAPGLFKLMEEAVKNHDHGLAEVALERLRTLLKALPEGSLKDEAMARGQSFVAAFDHHH